MPKSFWLFKNEVSDYTIADLKSDQVTVWTGVRNYQARNFMMKSMKVGDLGFFYHSNAEPSGCAGILRVSKEALPDPTSLDKKSKYFDPKATSKNPIWHCVEVEYVEIFSRIVSITEMRQNKKLDKLKILERGSRLSITPLTELEFLEICQMAKK